MKKVLIGIATVAALWLGATFYISSTIKEDVENYIQQVNSMYAQNGIKMSAEVQSSFFSSDMKVEIDLDKAKLDMAVLEIYGKFLTLPMKLDYKIIHGPIFFDGFGFGMAKIKGEIKLSNLLPEASRKSFLESAPDDLVITTNDVLCFDKTIHSKMSTNPFKMEADGDSLTMAAMEGSGTMDRKTLLGNASVKIPLISLQANEGNVTAKDMTLNMQLNDRLNDRYYFADLVFDVAKIEANGNDLLAPLEFDFHINSHTERASEGRMNLGFEISSNLLKGAKNLELAIEPVKIVLTVEGEELSVKLIEIGEKINQAQAEMMNSLYAQDANETNQSMTNAQMIAATETYASAVQEASKELLKEKTGIAATLRFITETDDQSHASMRIGYAGKPVENLSFEELATYLAMEPLEYLVLDTNISFNQKHISLLPVDKQEQIKQSLEMAAMQGSLMEQNGSYAGTLSYKPKTLMLNGEDKTQEMLPMIEMMMAAQQLAQQEMPMDATGEADLNASEAYQDEEAMQDSEGLDDQNISVEESEEDEVSSEDNQSL